VSQACVAAVYLRGHMDQQSLRLLILRKLRAGRLPRDGTRTVWSGPSHGETCDACDTVLAKTELLMEGLTLDLGRRPFRCTSDVSSSGITKGAPPSHPAREFAVHVPQD
jgi:hypothetical protein